MPGILINLLEKVNPNIKLKTLNKIIAGIIFLLLVSSSLILVFEPDSRFQGFIDALWWSIVTITTVGYGDKYPVTIGGRIIAIILMLTGIGIFGAVTATIADLTIDLRKRREQGKLPVKFKDHIIICGWCKKTTEIIKQITNEAFNKKIVLIANIDNNPYGNNNDIHFIQGEIDSEDILLKAGIMEADRVIILNEDNDDRSTVLAALTIENLNPDIYSIAEVNKKENRKHFENANVDEIIVNEEVNARLLVRSAFYPGTSRIIKDLISNEDSNEIYMFNSKKEDLKFTFLEIVSNYFQNENILIFAVKRNNEIIINPSPDFELAEKDKFVYIGKEKID